MTADEARPTRLTGHYTGFAHYPVDAVFLFSCTTLVPVLYVCVPCAAHIGEWDIINLVCRVSCCQYTSLTLLRLIDTTYSVHADVSRQCGELECTVL